MSCPGEPTFNRPSNARKTETRVPVGGPGSSKVRECLHLAGDSRWPLHAVTMLANEFTPRRSTAAATTCSSKTGRTPCDCREREPKDTIISSPDLPVFRPTCRTGLPTETRA
jgi:hypothetical protein